MPLQPAHYRGMGRCGPFYVDQLPESAPVNQAFLRCASNAGFIETAEDAFDIARLYEELGQYFEVVEILEKDDANIRKSAGGLGYDVVISRGWSLLEYGLARVPRPGELLDPLFDLVDIHFRSYLNSHGLFSTWEEAFFMVRVIKAVSEVRPNSWESPELISELDVVRLRLLREAAGPFPEPRPAWAGPMSADWDGAIGFRSALHPR